jgi:hypothetical protein
MGSEVVCSGRMHDRPLTLFDARNLLGKYAVDFDSSLNQALDRIYSEGTWPGLVTEIDLSGSITGGILRLPTEYETLFGASFNGVPISIAPISVEYSRAGPGYRESGEGSFVLVDLGPVPEAAEGDYPVLVRSYKVLFAVSPGDVLRGIAKRRFRILTDDSDYIYPGNITALKHALMAVNYEDNANQEQAAVSWAACFSALNRSTAQSRIGTPQVLAVQVSGLGVSRIKPRY